MNELMHKQEEYVNYSLSQKLSIETNLFIKKKDLVFDQFID
jgi:hypothetical protein